MFVLTNDVPSQLENKNNTASFMTTFINDIFISTQLKVMQNYTFLRFTMCQDIPASDERKMSAFSFKFLPKVPRKQHKVQIKKKCHQGG